MLLRRLTWPLVEFFYPGCCAMCEAASPSASRLCRSCDGLITNLERRPACRRCAAPSASADTPCPRCRDRGLRPFEFVVALGMFADPIRSLIHRIKYRHDWPMAETLAARLASHPTSQIVMDRAQLIVPIPLHPLRQLFRGYNQADVIARRLTDFSAAKIATPLVRTRNTRTQTELSIADRVKNVRDAFALQPHRRAVTGRHVVLVDDVMTTGATLRAAARVLLPLRPASLSAVVLAVSDPKGRHFETI